MKTHPVEFKSIKCLILLSQQATELKIKRLPSNLYNRHILIWICLIIYVSVDNFTTGTAISKFMYVFLFILSFLIIYYILLLIVFPSFFETKKILFILSFIAVAGIYTLMDYVHLKKVLPYFGGETPGVNKPFFEFAKGSLLLFSFIAFSAFGSYLNWRSVERARTEAEKEKGVISRELNFLKNQFHSHLTFNFLNFCYSKMLKSSPKAAESIESFSDMLRYSLSKKPEEFVLLQNEIEYIHNFITIQSCLSNAVHVEFITEGETENLSILPMLLAVFVENAFKHGTFSDPENPVQILLSNKNNNLFFQVSNSKTNQTPISTTGIGLKNVTQLLELFYRDKYTLAINETDHHYTTNLTLKIAS